MKRHWFQDRDGMFYRNLPLIMAEQARCRPCPWLWRHLRELDAEWDRAWKAGVIRKPALGRGDVLAHPAPMREAYPDRPGLWVLDEEWPMDHIADAPPEGARP
jgi:hypothetical protein